MPWFLKAAAAAGFVVLLWFLADWGRAAAAVAAAAPEPLAWALAVSVLGVLLSAEKWRGLLRRDGVPLSLGAAARLYWVGMFFSNFLPTSVGGDAARLLLTPAPGRRAEVAGSIVAERVTGLVVMLALCALGLALRPGHFEGVGGHRLLSAGVLAMGLAALALLLAPGLITRVLEAPATRRLPPLLAERPLGWARKLAAAVADQARDPAAIARALLLSVPFYGTIILTQHLVLRAVGAEVPLVEVALVAAVVPLLSLLPLAPNGLGVAEAAFVLLYAQLGVSPELGLAAALLRRLVDLANSGIGGLLWLGWRGTRRLDAPPPSGTRPRPRSRARRSRSALWSGGPSRPT
jgi:uncharacterized membrane protein YbhN (UPF0104 family)